MPQPSYLDIIRQYPIPTDEQTRAFAVYVAGAHSWYKHLPVYPPAPFCFYLDPNAGRSMTISADGDMAFEDIVDESTRFHYTWQLTETYREHLGYWNYFAPYGTHFQFARAGKLIDTRQSGDAEGSPVILVPKVGWLALPVALVQAGTAGVTALVHEHRNLHAYWGPATVEGTRKRIHLSEFLERHPDALAADVSEAMMKWIAYWNDPAFKRLQDKNLSEADDGEDSFVTHVVDPPLDHERQRQIANMEAAMHRFLDFVQEPGTDSPAT